MTAGDAAATGARGGKGLRRFEWLVVVSTTVAIGYLIGRVAPYRGANEPNLGLMAVVTLIGVWGVILWLAWRARRRARWGGSHFLLLVAALVLVPVAVQRWIGWHKLHAFWPPLPSRSLAADPGQLPDSNQAVWAADVVAHLVGSPEGAAVVPEVPVDWPFPSAATVALDSSDVALTVWARTPAGSVACIDLPRAVAPIDSTRRCASHLGRASQLAFSAPARGPAPDATAGTRPLGEPWVQYRNGPDRPGAVVGAADSGVTGWRVTTPGPIRASVSVIGSTVLVGGHGTGSLLALDLHDGHLLWRARLPSWIHQDPVSDGRVVVVGFGDNWSSFTGLTPSGVAAYDLATGARLWTEFDESSVMTSAMIAGDQVIYATAAGVLRKRSLATGALADSTLLPGGVIMAPLAMQGDTLVATLDRDRVCALRAGDLSRIWCRRFNNLRKVGHSAPAVRDGRVIVSGETLLSALTLRDFRSAGPGLRTRMLREILNPPGDENAEAGQTFLALNLATGRIEWGQPNYAYRYWVRGHISGTASLRDSIGVIVLPMADTLVAFDPRSGDVHWSHGSHRARGAPLILGDQVLVAGRDGITELRDLATGALHCVMTRDTGYDRGGPTAAGGLVIFANLKGVVEAIPDRDLLTCRGPGLTLGRPEE